MATKQKTKLPPKNPPNSLRKTASKGKGPLVGYQETLSDLVELLQAARRNTIRSVNTIMTTTYWLIGKRIVEQEQRGQSRASYYGEELVEKLAQDLSQQFGRGFSERGLWRMRRFYLLWSSPRPTIFGSSNFSLSSSPPEILPTLLAESFKTELSLVARFPLPWSHYIRLMSVESEKARAFYEEEALRGGWTIRQLDRQIGTQFYERTLLSKDKAAMLRKGAIAKPEDTISLEEEMKDPLLLEFTGLKDEYSEGQLEESLILNLESFLLELGNGFTFIGRQKRLRIDDEWYRVDLLLYHRKLRCLVIIDLKLEKFTHADMGQMHVYLNYAKTHWMMEGENPPVGIILCSEKRTELAHYAFEGLSNKILAAEYKTSLPSEEVLAEQLQKIRKQLELRAITEAHTVGTAKEDKDSA